MIIQSGLHENQSKLAIKSCKDDALAAFKQGEVAQEIVDKYTEKEQGKAVHLACSRSSCHNGACTPVPHGCYEKRIA